MHQNMQSGGRSGPRTKKKEEAWTRGGESRGFRSTLPSSGDGARILLIAEAAGVGARSQVDVMLQDPGDTSSMSQ